jgi:predicted nucleic acid-binding protein
MSSGSQAQLCFIDTNIWLYAFIPSQDRNKSAKAIIQQSDIVISSQVINSFYNRYNVGLIDKDTLLKSSELREKMQLSFWDSLIVSSALLGEAEILYTEDMSDGMVIEGSLTIINPVAL